MTAAAKAKNLKADTGSKYESVTATPVKSFFVTMLTRDITLEEAILDLLDNCVDGILRSHPPSGKAKRPYAGYWASIDFTSDSFTISDNCGGIPWKLHEYAFRMGRDKNREPDARGSVGIYGIGMKRAIFKLGRECLISTQHEKDRYEVDISPDWLDDEDSWDIPVRPGKRQPEDGTTVYVTDLHEGVRRRFTDDSTSFQSDLENMIATHYTFIIDKGFEVKVNGVAVRPRATRLIFAEQETSIRPFMFMTASDGVEVFLTVGFTRPIPSADEAASEQEDKKYSTENAGWTVVCNDRAVLYCDRTEMTGWGEAGVPRYHTQFIAISGIVEFRSDDPAKLPTTTTKRGIDASSTLYLQVKNKMREGMRLFTTYTNKWKNRADEARQQMEAEQTLSFGELKAAAKRVEMRATTRTVPAGKQYTPNLPMPAKADAQKRRISYSKHLNDIRVVSEHLFGDSDADPSEVGERCFDVILARASE
ncbi:MAG TPA: ATP-binding protein [Thermoanaerobaculia bacterium]|jgi:hypothetical protein